MISRRTLLAALGLSPIATVPAVASKRTVVFNIEYDIDTKQAVVSVNGRPGRTWRDVDLSIDKEVVETEEPVWTVRRLTGHQSFTLKGVVTT